MALESFSGIWSLNRSNPTASDDINQGDDHLRGIKASIRQTFPEISATVNVSASEINHLSGVASNIQNTLSSFSASLASQQSTTDTLTSKTNTLSASLSAEISRTDTLSASLAALISNVDTISSSLQAVISANQVAYGGMFITTPGSIFSASASAQAFTGFDTPMPNGAVTVATAAGSLTPSVTGVYSVAFNFSFSGDASTQFSAELYQDNAATRIGFSRSLGASSDIGAAGASGIISANASSVLAVRITGTAGGDDFTPNYGQFFISRINSNA